VREAWVVLGVAVAVLAQTVLVPEIRAVDSEVGPDLLLTTACLCALYAPAPQAVAAGWACGFAKDLCSTGPLGLHALVFAAVAALLAQRRGDLFRDHPLTQLGLVGACVLACEGVTGLVRLQAASGWGVLGDLGRIAGRAAAAALYAGLLAPVVFRVARGWWRLGRTLRLHAGT
jgi:rod shape-determining protein MreD